MQCRREIKLCSMAAKYCVLYLSYVLDIFSCGTAGVEFRVVALNVFFYFNTFCSLGLKELIHVFLKIYKYLLVGVSLH